MKELTHSINHCLKKDFLIEVTKLEPFLLGADLNASLYKIEDAHQKTYFVKIRRGLFPETPAKILTFLQEAGIKQIIPPIKTKEGKLLQQIGDFTLTIYPFIQGQDGFSSSLKDSQWIAFGKTLKKIHEIKVPEEIQNTIRCENFSPKWRDCIPSFFSHKTENDETGEKFKEFLKEKRDVIEQLHYRTEQLMIQLTTESFPYVLCHSDIHAGNLLLEKENIYLIDWDEPIMAPKERDLMFIGGGVGNVWNQQREGKLFYEGYGKTEINQTLIAYYRHERILIDLSEYVEALLLKNYHKDRVEMYKQCVDMFEKNGVVDIALRTVI